MNVIISAVVLAIPISALAAAAAYYFSMRRLGRSLGIYDSPFRIEHSIGKLIQRSERLRAVATGFDLEAGIDNQCISGDLQSIVSRAGAELRAKSAELCLFDSESGLAAQSFVVGAPVSALSRGILSEEELAQGSGIVKQELGELTILFCPVRFARKTFGALQFEFARGTVISQEQEQLAQLFSRQAAIAVLDSQFAEELLRMRRLSDESVRSKTGFLANLSHELRGPLGIILNGAELALEGLYGPVSDSIQQTLRMIKSNGEHLLELVNDVLDYAKVEAGKIVTNPVEISLKPLLTDLMRIAQGQAEQKGHRLTLETVDETLGVVADRRHLRQMIINLITNAIKYTPDGGHITLAASALSGGKVKITVTDTGVGIPEDQRHKVFGAFERVQHSYSEKQAGSGLGMPLTRKLAEANGGSIDFDSELGKGSKFWLILPGVRVARGAVEVTDSKAKMKLGRNEKIVIVDADNEYRDLMARFLAEQGYQTFQLSTPREIIKLFKETSVDAAILDSDVIGMELEEFVIVLRAHPKGSSIPLIITSPSAFSFDVESYLKLGVDRCLSKPINFAEVTVAVRQLLDEYSPQQLVR